MLKYIKFELVSIVCFILLFIFSRLLGSSVSTNHQLNTVMAVLFMISLLSSLIVIPAMILLSFRDKAAPGPLSYNKDKNRSGRLNRRNYIIATSILGVLGWILSLLLIPFIPQIAQSIPFLIIFQIFLLILFIPTVLFSISISVRRLHDIGLSEYWLLIGLIPIANIIMSIILFVKEGEKGTNIYGDPPPQQISFPADLLRSRQIL